MDLIHLLKLHQSAITCLETASGYDDEHVYPASGGEAGQLAYRWVKVAEKEFIDSNQQRIIDLARVRMRDHLDGLSQELDI